MLHNKCRSLEKSCESLRELFQIFLLSRLSSFYASLYVVAFTSPFSACCVYIFSPKSVIVDAHFNKENKYFTVLRQRSYWLEVKIKISYDKKKTFFSVHKSYQWKVVGICRGIFFNNILSDRIENILIIENFNFVQCHKSNKVFFNKSVVCMW